MKQHVVSAQDSSNSIRSYRLPVLEAGNLSFPNGKYILEFERSVDGSSINICHRIEGARLISELLENRCAEYACIVSSPISSYRDITRSNDPTHAVEWDEKDMGEPPLLTPMIVCSVDREIVLNSREHEVHEIWDGRTIAIEKGTRLALGPVFQLQGSILHLLKLTEDSNLGKGEFRVAAVQENGFRFRVNLHPELHQYLKVDRGDGTRPHIMTHIVTACLALLQREYPSRTDEEDGQSDPRGLMVLGDHLKSRKLPHWRDEEFQPELVATKLYPHELPVQEYIEQ